MYCRMSSLKLTTRHGGAKERANSPGGKASTRQDRVCTSGVHFLLSVQVGCTSCCLYKCVDFWVISTSGLHLVPCVQVALRIFGISSPRLHFMFLQVGCSSYLLYFSTRELRFISIIFPSSELYFVSVVVPTSGLSFLSSRVDCASYPS